jgi:hypothetical protein
MNDGADGQLGKESGLSRRSVSEVPKPKTKRAALARQALNEALLQAAAIEGAFPAGFTAWDLKVHLSDDDDEWETVGHVHAMVHVFPIDFPFWGCRIPMDIRLLMLPPQKESCHEASPCGISLVRAVLPSGTP